MSQTQSPDRISISSINSNEDESSTDNESNEEQDEFNCPMQINDTAPRTNNITMNNPKHTNVGDSHNFYGPVTLHLHPKNDELVKNIIENGEDVTNIEMDCGDANNRITIDSATLGQESPVTSNTQKNQQVPQQQQPQCTNVPQVNVTIPHESLNQTFGFLVSKRLKMTLIIVLAGTSLFIAGIIVLEYFLNKNFYDGLPV